MKVDKVGNLVFFNTYYVLDPSKTTSFVGKVIDCSLGEMSALGGLFTRFAESKNSELLYCISYNSSIYLAIKASPSNKWRIALWL